MLGRKPFPVNDAMRNAVEMLTAFGMTEDQICQLVLNPITRKPLSRKILTRKFKTELATGLLKANTLAAGKLFELVKKGVPSAVFFWLKTRARWKERYDIEVTHVLTPEILAAVNWNEFREEEIAIMEAGRLTNELLTRILASARSASGHAGAQTAAITDQTGTGSST